MSLKIFCEGCDKYTDPNEKEDLLKLHCGRCQHIYSYYHVWEYNNKVKKRKEAKQRKEDNDKVIRSYRLKTKK